MTARNLQPHLTYRQGVLHLEGCDLIKLAKQSSTPCYVYSTATLTENWQAFSQHWGNQAHSICYAVKANSNLAVLNHLHTLGSGFDIVSAGELHRVLTAGGDMNRVVFSGVGKSADELQYALENKIKCFNIESESELILLNKIAIQTKKKAPIALRVNPDISAGGHPYISTGLKKTKFGIPDNQAITLYQKARSLPGITIQGISCHIGSQINALEPFLLSAQKILQIVKTLEIEGIKIQHIDLGGGLGVSYHNEVTPSIADYIHNFRNHIDAHAREIIIEPGRSMVAPAGILITRVLHIKNGKERRFAIVDAGMNDLMRCALYDAWHTIVPIQKKSHLTERPYDIVGPVCETGDCFATERNLAIEQGDLVAILHAGAYGFSMSSNYNTRPRASEWMVCGKKANMIRKRESLADMIQHEPIP